MLAIFMIIASVLLRLVPHVPNFAPIAATALFGGTYLKKRYAIIIPMATLIISDYLLLYVNPFQSPMINFSKIHPLTAMINQSTFYVWGSFVLIGFIGIWLRSHKNAHNVVLGSLASSILFFLITNFGFWLAYDLYPKTLDGQILAYIMALPFFKWTMLGDLFYTGVFFGAYEFGLRTAQKTRTALAI